MVTYPHTDTLCFELRDSPIGIFSLFKYLSLYLRGSSRIILLSILKLFYLLIDISVRYGYEVSFSHRDIRKD